uniref:(northern house mosquito) hypothetical protein n=1 Tax=Culex pipiens TaxID=7175 RepID=A0A8D8CEM7_CULPI
MRSTHVPFECVDHVVAELDGLLLWLLPGALLLLWSRWFHLPDLERRQRMLKRLLPLLLLMLLLNVNSRRTLSWPPLEGGPLLGPPRGHADTEARARLLLRVADVVDADG